MCSTTFHSAADRCHRRILGVDIEARAEFREWSEGVIQVLNPFRTPDQTAYLERAGEAISTYFEDQIC